MMGLLIIVFCKENARGAVNALRLCSGRQSNAEGIMNELKNCTRQSFWLRALKNSLGR